MAKTTGYTCDSCGAFTAAAEVNLLPVGWMQVRLPRGEGDSDGGLRDICSGKCLERFGRERKQAEAGNAPRTVASASRERPNSMTPELRKWLDANGVESRLRGGVIGRHAHRHQTTTDDNCLVCQFEEAS